MRVFRGLLWVLLAVAIVTVAIDLTGNDAIVDRLTGLFLTVQLELPLALNFDQFLVILTGVSLLAAILLFSGCVVIVIGLSLSYEKKLRQAMVVKREVDYLRGEHQRRYEQLLSLGQALNKRLDKQVLVQTIIEAASRMTSVAQANSIVSLWLLSFETDTIRFERGLYCDEAMFLQTEFQLTEQPFSRVISTQQPGIFPAGDEGLTMVRREKFSQLRSTPVMMVIPLLVENSVMGVLVLFCHSDILKNYEEQTPFYDVVWGKLALGLAIAVQGEVAILDRLTGTHNREYFMKRLTQEIERSNRYQLPLSLLMVDIDNFKLVNDMLGHPQGDAVLRIIAKLIKKSVRVIDLVGRYGGEEFIVMLPDTGYGEDATSATGALVVAERIRKAVDDEFRGLQKPLNLTVSVGIAVRRFPEDRVTDYRELIRLADEQLYRAKTTGKNKVSVVLPEKPQEVS
jgi:diguanylate cyclase (GGDEF)-like protein